MLQLIAITQSPLAHKETHFHGTLSHICSPLPIALFGIHGGRRCVSFKYSFSSAVPTFTFLSLTYRIASTSPVYAALCKGKRSAHLSLLELGEPSEQRRVSVLPLAKYAGAYNRKHRNIVLTVPHPWPYNGGRSRR